MVNKIQSPSRSWWRPAAGKLLPGVVLLIFLVYYIRMDSFSSQIPTYGDFLEALWGTNWFLDGFRDESINLLFAPHVFMPEGWSTATFAFGLGLFMMALPIAAITNIAVALNVLQLASFFIAFFGIYCLARLMISRPTACLIALLYLLWGGRWLRISGQLNVLLASALIPWLILFLERTITTGRRWPRWAAATALVWTLAISVSLYFIWVGIFIFAGWLLGGVFSRRITLKSAILRMAVISGLALLLCSPYLYLYWRGQLNTVGYEIWHINSWSLSLNWLPSLYPSHSIPILRDIARWQVNDVFLESSHVGFGVVLLVMAALGLTARSRRPAQWGGILLTIAFGIILALGPTLHWGGKIVSLDIMQPINKLIWDIGHTLKPDIFVEQSIRPDFASAIPLPGLILSATVPFFEGARVPARFMLLAAPGILLLAGIGLERIPKPWLKMVIMALLLVEASR